VSLFLLNSLNFTIAFAFTALLFALVFKYMSDADISWRSIWPGALFTALLFVIGKYLMGLYFGKLKIDDGYGAAGSIVLLLTWVFYSSQIVFFGAEFTHALAAEHGKMLDPVKILPDADEEVLQTHITI
jgi:membrane protein